MGGHGSGRWGRGGKADAKTLREACRSLDIRRFVRDGVVRPDARTSGSWAWSRDGVVVAAVDYEADTRADAGILRLRHPVGPGPGGGARDYSVPLVTTAPSFGGRRWWFLCPARRDAATPCRRRVGKLYLPPGGQAFACRHCHRLAYTSSRESRKYDALFKALAASAGMPLGAAGDLLRRDPRGLALAMARKSADDVLRRVQGRGRRHDGEP